MTTYTKEELTTALNKAKIALMSKADSTFFTQLCFSLKHVFDETTTTASADGVTLRFNPTFFMGMDVDERIFLLIHETMHCAYLHMERFQSWMCPDRANIAMDHAINLQLIASGFKMPKNGHADPAFTGMNWEAIYPLLPANPGKPMMADIRAAPAGMKPEQLESDMQDILVRAALQSQIANDKPGTIPGDIEIFLNRLLNPKLPWHRILYKYLRNFAKNDYSFRKPNRRFFPKYHLPSLYSENLIDLAIAMDVSGSVSDHDFLNFVTEMASLMKMMKPENITLIQFDTNLKSVNKIKNLQELMQLTFTGRGGTDITPVLEWANKNKPQLLLVFSDGEFRFPDITTKVNTLWVIHNSPEFIAPFGKIIHYHVGEGQ